MSTASFAANPLPDSEIALVGGPTLRESAIPGSTLKLAELVPNPEGLVTETWPVLASVGTAARMDVLESTANDDATPPKVTLLAPVKPEPAMLTVVPSAPCDGVNEETVVVAQLVAGRTP